MRQGLLLLGLGLVCCSPGCGPRPARPSQPGSVTTALEPEPTPAAPSDPCRAGRERARQELARTDQATRELSQTLGEESLLLMWNELSAPLRRCWDAGQGAWMLLPTRASLDWELDPGSFSSPGEADAQAEQVELPAFAATFRLTYLAPDGQQTGSQREHLITRRLVDDETSSAAVVAVVDYDADGISEIIVRHDHLFREEGDRRCVVWTVADGQVQVYPPTRDLRIWEPIDFDDDGRLDLVTNGQPWRGRPCGGMGPSSAGFPPVLYHSLPDGQFSSSDQVAAAYLRQRCPDPPQDLIRISETDWDLQALTRIACARLWGAPVDQVQTQVRSEWDQEVRPQEQAGAMDESCADLESFLAHAAVEPPLRLDRQAGAHK